MNDDSKQPSTTDSGGREAAGQKHRPRSEGGLRKLHTQHPWLVFVLPFVVYMIFNSLEPTPPEPQTERTDAVADQHTEPSGAWLPIDYDDYPLIYTLKLLATGAAIWLVWPGFRQFPLRVSPLAPLVGAVGCLVWVGICGLRLEARLGELLGVTWLIEMGQRPGFNPLEQLADRPLLAYGFLVIRFTGLAVVVPVIEEFFLRGFLMRYLVREDWSSVPFGTPDARAIAIVTVLAMAMHPAELVAELVWFSLVTWLMIRTRNIWDCVVAHGTTNLLLGFYVVTTGHWELM